jgi:hypothetical protein
MLWSIKNVIGKLDIFPLMSVADKVWITELTLIHKNIMSVRNLHVQVYQSIWYKTHYDVTDKNNNVSSEGLDRHYHKYPSSAYPIHWYISDNVCLNLQNCHYSIHNFEAQINLMKDVWPIISFAKIDPLGLELNRSQDTHWYKIES